MMLKANISSKILYLIPILFALTVMAPASFAGKSQDCPPPVTVVNQAVDGAVVHVTVKNLSRTAQTVNVMVDATVAGKRVRGYTPVSVFAGGTAETVVGFADVVDNVGSVGIIDEGSPL